MPRESKDIKFNSGYNTCEARMQILKNETVQKDLEYEEINKEDTGTKSYIYVDNNGTPAKLKLATLIDPKEGTQSDWDVTDETSLAFIKNKPNFSLDEDIVSSYNVGGIRVGTVLKAGSTALDILKLMLTSTEIVQFKFGVVRTPGGFRPQDIPDLEPIEVTEVLKKGLYVPDVKTENEYYILLVPQESNLVVSQIRQNGYSISFKQRVIGSYDAYYQSVPTTGTYSFRYLFKKKEEE